MLPITLRVEVSINESESVSYTPTRTSPDSVSLSIAAQSRGGPTRGGGLRFANWLLVYDVIVGALYK